MNIVTAHIQVVIVTGFRLLFRAFVRNNRRYSLLEFRYPERVEWQYLGDTRLIN